MTLELKLERWMMLGVKIVKRLEWQHTQSHTRTIRTEREREKKPSKVWRQIYYLNDSSSIQANELFPSKKRRQRREERGEENEREGLRKGEGRIEGGRVKEIVRVKGRERKEKEEKEREWEREGKKGFYREEEGIRRENGFRRVK